MVKYFRWREQFTDLPVEPHLQFFRDELTTAADYRQALVRAALQLAFSNDPAQRSAAGRETLTGLEAAHDQLVDLLNHLDSHVPSPP